MLHKTLKEKIEYNRPILRLIQNYEIDAIYVSSISDY